MRVATGHSLRLLRDGFTWAAREIERLSLVLSSGKKLTRPSEDPIAVPNVLAARSAVATAEVRQQMLTDADQWVRASDSMLGDVTNALQRAGDIGRSIQDVALDEAVGAALASELRDLREHLIALANSQHANRYLFAGTETRTQPFTVEADGTVTYNGDSGELVVGVSPGRRMAYNISGDRAFNMGGVVDPALPDVFEALDEMANAIELGSTGLAVEATQKVDALFELCLEQRAKVGVVGQRVEWARNYTTDETLRSQVYLADVEDADLTETLLDYQAAQVTYQATIYAANRVAALPTLFELM